VDRAPLHDVVVPDHAEDPVLAVHDRQEPVVVLREDLREVVAQVDDPGERSPVLPSSLST